MSPALTQLKKKKSKGVKVRTYQSCQSFVETQPLLGLRGREGEYSSLMTTFPMKLMAPLNGLDDHYQRLQRPWRLPRVLLSSSSAKSFSYQPLFRIIGQRTPERSKEYFVKSAFWSLLLLYFEHFFLKVGATKKAKINIGLHLHTITTTYHFGQVIADVRHQIALCQNYVYVTYNTSCKKMAKYKLVLLLTLREL